MVEEIVALIKNNPVSAGEIHPADGIISLEAKNNSHYIEIFYLIISSYPEIRADFFKLLCRLDSSYLDNLMFHGICRRFLNDNSVEVVDAAIGMFESFADKSILNEWLETKPSYPKWILDYAFQVVNQDSSFQRAATHSTNS